MVGVDVSIHVVLVRSKTGAQVWIGISNLAFDLGFRLWFVLLYLIFNIFKPFRTGQNFRFRPFQDGFDFTVAYSSKARPVQPVKLVLKTLPIFAWTNMAQHIPTHDTSWYCLD